MPFSIRNTGALLLATAYQNALARPAQMPYEATYLHSILKRSADGPWFNDFADPGLLKCANGTFYAYATNADPIGAGPLHVPVAQSSGLDSGWEIVTDDDGVQVDAMPVLPPWIAPGGNQVWAPDVIQLADGSYSMLFASPGNVSSGDSDPNRNLFCIGIASSDSPTGPFTSTEQPLYCDDSQSIIDGSHFMDVDGSNYFLFSGAGNLNIHPLDSSNTIAQGEAKQILAADPSVDAAGVTEAPFLVNANGVYYLFFSTGTYNQADYTTSYATSDYLLGPYTQAGPLLQTGDAIDGSDNTLLGPGGATLIANGNGGYNMAFHGLTQVGDPSPRPLYTATVSFSDDGTPVVE